MQLMGADVLFDNRCLGLVFIEHSISLSSAIGYCRLNLQLIDMSPRRIYHRESTVEFSELKEVFTRIVIVII